MIKKILKKKCLENKTFNSFYKLCKKNNIKFYDESKILCYKTVKKKIINKNKLLIENFKKEINNFTNNDLVEKVKSKIISLENDIKSLNKNLSLLNILEENNMYNENHIEKINYDIFTRHIDCDRTSIEKFTNKCKYLAEYSNS